MEDLSLIPCSLADVKTLSKVAQEAYNDHYLYLWNDEGKDYVERNLSETALEKELKEKTGLWYLVGSNSEWFGFVKINPFQALHPYTAEEALEIERLYLKASATGKGIGKAILQKATEMAQQQQQKVIWLKSMDSAPALQFYLSQGFEVLAQQTLPYAQMKVEYRTLLTLIKKLA